MVSFCVAHDERIRLYSVFSLPIHCLVKHVLVIDRNLSISQRYTFNINKHSHLRMTRTHNKDNMVRMTHTRPLSGKSYLASRSLSYYSVLL